MQSQDHVECMLNLWELQIPHITFYRYRIAPRSATPDYKESFGQFARFEAKCSEHGLVCVVDPFSEVVYCLDQELPSSCLHDAHFQLQPYILSSTRSHFFQPVTRPEVLEVYASLYDVVVRNALQAHTGLRLLKVEDRYLFVDISSRELLYGSIAAVRGIRMRTIVFPTGNEYGLFFELTDTFIVVNLRSVRSFLEELAGGDVTAYDIEEFQQAAVTELKQHNLYTDRVGAVSLGDIHWQLVPSACPVLRQRRANDTNASGTETVLGYLQRTVGGQVADLRPVLELNTVTCSSSSVSLEGEEMKWFSTADHVFVWEEVALPTGGTESLLEREFQERHSDSWNNISGFMRMCTTNSGFVSAMRVWKIEPRSGSKLYHHKVHMCPKPVLLKNPDDRLRSVPLTSTGLFAPWSPEDAEHRRTERGFLARHIPGHWSPSGDGTGTPIVRVGVVFAGEFDALSIVTVDKSLKRASAAYGYTVDVVAKNLPLRGRPDELYRHVRDWVLCMQYPIHALIAFVPNMDSGDLTSAAVQANGFGFEDLCMFYDAVRWFCATRCQIPCFAFDDFVKWGVGRSEDATSNHLMVYAYTLLTSCGGVVCSPLLPDVVQRFRLQVLNVSIGRRRAHATDGGANSDALAVVVTGSVDEYCDRYALFGQSQTVAPNADRSAVLPMIYEAASAYIASALSHYKAESGHSPEMIVVFMDDDLLEPSLCIQWDCIFNSARSKLLQNQNAEERMDVQSMKFTTIRVCTEAAAAGNIMFAESGDHNTSSSPMEPLPGSFLSAANAHRNAFCLCSSPIGPRLSSPLLQARPTLYTLDMDDCRLSADVDRLVDFCYRLCYTCTVRPCSQSRPGGLGYAHRAAAHLLAADDPVRLDVRDGRILF